MISWIRGWVFLIRKVGVRRSLAYELDRRRGRTLDYAAALNRDELAVLGERFDPAPWERT